MTVNITEYVADVYGMGYQDFRAKYPDWRPGKNMLISQAWDGILGSALSAPWAYKEALPQAEITTTVEPP